MNFTRSDLFVTSKVWHCLWDESCKLKSWEINKYTEVEYSKWTLRKKLISP